MYIPPSVILLLAFTKLAAFTKEENGRPRMIHLRAFLPLRSMCGDSAVCDSRASGSSVRYPVLVFGASSALLVVSRSRSAAVVAQGGRLLLWDGAAAKPLETPRQTP
eukprot:GHVT01020910.1.p5 GENE.GHVT01020910.1~~GHVT01020910.1.p5  ORF type:complete len:107 (+),score=22.93 GHVT01020910.1:1675-1995(+)